MDATLKELARNAYEQSPDIEQATNIALRKLDEDEALKATLSAELVLKAIRASLQEVMLAGRAKAKFLPTRCTRGVEAMQAVAGVAAQSLLDSWKFADGRMLGDLTGDELIYKAEIDQSKSNGYAMNAAFYKTLAGKVGNSETIRSKVTAEDAERLWLNIKESIETAA